MPTVRPALDREKSAQLRISVVEDLGQFVKLREKKANESGGGIRQKTVYFCKLLRDVLTFRWTVEHISTLPDPRDQYDRLKGKSRFVVARAWPCVAVAVAVAAAVLS